MTVLILILCLLGIYTIIDIVSTVMYGGQEVPQNVVHLYENPGLKNKDKEEQTQVICQFIQNELSKLPENKQTDDLQQSIQCVLDQMLGLKNEQNYAKMKDLAERIRREGAQLFQHSK